jgi:hypothetical protein
MKRMTDQKQWKKVDDVVRRLIHQWDPYRLLQIGAPEDEWDREIGIIVGRARGITSVSDATDIISEVFSSAFQPEGFGRDDCTEVGRKLYEELTANGLIDSSETPED